jgi:short-subunit dehydrogenase
MLAKDKRKSSLDRAHQCPQYIVASNTQQANRPKGYRSSSMRHPKSILITGASSGIGESLARRYAGPSVTLFLAGRNSERLSDVACVCEEAGASVFTIVLDVTDTARMSDWIFQSDRQAPLDIIIANAGISGGTSGGIEPARQTRRIFDVNVDGVLNTVLPGFDVMSQREHGQIAIVSSLAGFLPLPSAPAYGASKAAVRHFGEAFRISASQRGVAVSVVCPGFVHSKMTTTNPFPMPFIMTGEKAARIIAKGLQKNRARIAFPWLMYCGIWLLGSLCPSALLRVLLRCLPAKPAVSDDSGL